MHLLSDDEIFRMAYTNRPNDVLVQELCRRLEAVADSIEAEEDLYLGRPIPVTQTPRNPNEH